MPLLAHEPRTVLAQLDARHRVDDVVDASVQRAKAAAELAVRRIHDGIAAQRRNVALPKREARVELRRGEVRRLRDAFGCRHGLQQLMLHGEELG